jgi:hypothetical protein
LTKEEEQYYELYFDLFSHDGWKQFITEIQDSMDVYRIEDIKSESDLKTVQGNLQILQRIVSFEDAMRNAYDSNVEAANV